MIEVCQTSLPGVLRIVRPVFRDHRGIYTEEYNEQEYFNAGVPTKWVSQTCSLSVQNVLRGLHGDPKTWKLATCLCGEIYFVVLNYDPDSPYYGKWEAFTLTPQNGLQILVPPMHANGHLIVGPMGLFSYNQSEYYTDGSNQFSVRWDDSRFNIFWPVRNPILSARDGGTKKS